MNEENFMLLKYSLATSLMNDTCEHKYSSYFALFFLLFISIDLKNAIFKTLPNNIVKLRKNP